jgi:hypothetical protein
MDRPMQFPVQQQAVDFKGAERSMPWRNFANGEILDNGSAQGLRTRRGTPANLVGAPLAF